MLKLKVLSIGKNKENWLDEALKEYVKRLKSCMAIEWIWAKDDEGLVELVQKEPSVICLDPQGKLFTSEELATFLAQAWEKSGSRLAIVIGGADGLPPILRKNYPLISLSPLTFTHQITRLVLIEQIYRSIEIQKGSNYHK